MAYTDKIAIDSPTTTFDSVLTVQKTPLFQPINSVWNTSTLRDVETTSGSAGITTSNGEFVLTTGTTASSSADLRTSERGRYVAGQECEAGIGIRLPDSPAFAGTAYAQWGYYDVNNGFGFGKDATGVYVFTRRATTDMKVYQSSWNGDVMDGTGDSGYTLDLADGNIFQMEFTWYGYGTIEFQIIVDNGGNNQEVVTVHRFSPDNETSIADPNQPVRAEINNGDQTTNYAIYATGRQFSVLGNYNPTRRIISQRRLSLGSVGTTYLPTVSFRKKSAYESGTVRVAGVSVITDADLLYQIRLNGSLTGASYTTPNDITAKETFLETDVSATAISGGESLYEDLVLSGVGASRGLGSLTELPVAIPTNLPVTLCVRRVGSGSSTVSVVFRMIEEW